jgi:hypothetical protein
MAGDANTQTYENIPVKAQNLNVKMLLSYAVTVFYVDGIKCERR